MTKILNSGYRVAYKFKSIGSKLRFTVYYATIEQAERVAESLRLDGKYVITIERKE
jgi:hypothetical protein